MSRMLAESFERAAGCAGTRAAAEGKAEGKGEGEEAAG